MADIVKVAEGSDNGSQPASVPALPRPASPVPDTFGHDAGVGTHDSAHPPRYGPAVLRALAAYASAIAAHDNAPSLSAERLAAGDRACLALDALNDALRTDRTAAVPALPDEGERDVSPHRFKAARGMEPL